MPADDITRRQLHWLMRAQGAKRADLARVTGRTRQLVSRWLNGTRGVSDEDLQKIADYFSVSVAFLRYGGSHVDTDALAQITAGVLDGLRDQGVIHTDANSEQVGQLVAWAYERYTAHGHPPTADELKPLLKMFGLPASGEPAALRKAE